MTRNSSSKSAFTTEAQRHRAAQRYRDLDTDEHGSSGFHGSSQVLMPAGSTTVDDRRHPGIEMPFRTRAFGSASQSPSTSRLRRAGPAYARNGRQIPPSFRNVECDSEGSSTAETDRACQRHDCGMAKIDREVLAIRGRSLLCRASAARGRGRLAVGEPSEQATSSVGLESDP